MQLHDRKMALFVGWIAAGLLWSAHAHARQAPPSLGLELTGRVNLSSQDISRVRAYADYWTSRISGDSPDSQTVEEARKQLMRPLQNMEISPDFRFNYSNFVVPSLEDSIEASNLHQSTNAILVISQIGTEQALSALVDHSDQVFQPVWQIRLAAVRGCRSLMNQSTIEQGGRLAAVNRLQQATMNEDQNRVLQLQFAAINAADHSEVPDPTRQQLRSAMLNAVTSVIDEVERNNNPKPNPLIGALNSGIIMLREQYINIRDVQANERRAIAEELAPRLGKILSIINSNWQAGQDDANLRELYGVVSGTCESFISIIDTQLRGDSSSPRPQLQHAWTAKDQGRYESVLQKWLDILGQPPYQQR